MIEGPYGGAEWKREQPDGRDTGPATRFTVLVGAEEGASLTSCRHLAQRLRALHGQRAPRIRETPWTAFRQPAQPRRMTH